jgi:hypothetical protein
VGSEVLSRNRVTSEIANQLAQEWQNSGESLESMLKTLREVRVAYDEKNSKNLSRYQRNFCYCAFGDRRGSQTLQA